MVRRLALSFLLFLIVGSLLQAQVDAGEDQQITEGTPVILEGEFTGTYGNMIAAWDDDFEGPFSIGFTFDFYGEAFNEVHIGPNGIISFSENPPTYYQDVPEIPGDEIPLCIMGPYQDLFSRPLDQPHSQYMYYGTIGTAPYRKFVAGWCEAPMFVCDDQKSTLQIVLEENTDRIYNHLISKPQCDDHLNNLATQGLNFDPDLGVAVEGRNRSSWTAYQESWLFDPINEFEYDISQIDFTTEPIIPEDNISYTWYENQYPDGKIIGNNKKIIVAPKETTRYFCEITLCGGITSVDEVNINVIPLPNAFNPNSSNELNRYFIIPLNTTAEVIDFQILIFNRWGQQVFESNDPDHGWDGNSKNINCLPGVYVWMIRYQVEGETISNQGNVTLVR